MKKLLVLSLLSIAGFSLSNAMEIKVQVPSGTKKCYICGAFNNWDTSTAPQLNSNGDNTFSINLDVTSSDLAKGYKYLCGQDWKFVEKDANGNEIDNRTSYKNPDVVAKWYNQNLWDIKEIDLTINNIKRMVTVYLPEGYDNSSESYPVIYYNTVPQRYSNAGDDNDNGDNLFGANSWNAPQTMENVRSVTNQAYILVQIPSMLAENTVSQHNDFIGTGDADLYLNSFVTDLIPYIQNNFRVKKGPDNNIIMGADHGAVFSLYAALSRPDLFGVCIALSPMLWINEGDIEAMVPSAKTNQTYYLSVGEREPNWMKQHTENLYNILSDNQNLTAYYNIYKNAAHNDDDWGVSFNNILAALPSLTAPQGSVGYALNTRAAVAIDDPSDFANNTYTLYYGTQDDKSSLKKYDSLIYEKEYYKKGVDEVVDAFVITYPLGLDYKSWFYWNIKKGDPDNGEWLLKDNKNIEFKSKKTVTSWHNIAIFSDETIQDVAVHSENFLVVVNDKENIMSKKNDYVSEVTLDFGDIKEFCIKYGSVNSGGTMDDPLTHFISVGKHTTQAKITYDFNLNKVDIEVLATDGKEEEDKDLPEFKERSYKVYGAAGKDLNNSQLQPVGDMEYTTEFMKKDSTDPTTAFVFVNEIDADIKNTIYYWNIKNEDNGDWVLSSPKFVSFTDKKDTKSLHLITLYDNHEIDNTAVHSDGFVVVFTDDTGNKNPLKLTKGDDYIYSSDTKIGNTKSFEIKFGSVNSNSIQSALTSPISVSDDCTKATITYNFKLNTVKVEETENGNNNDDPVIDVPKPEFSSRKYTVYGGYDKSNLIQLGNMSYTNDYRKKGTSEAVEAFIYVNDIPTNGKTASYYWNIKDENGYWILDEPKDIGFKDSKTETSWHSIALFDDEKTENTAAHSKGFTIKQAGNTIVMSQQGSHSAFAKVTFPSKDKTFQVNYGSVNSGSIMPDAMTPTIKLDDDCLAADITYDFSLNKVTAVVTERGDVSDLLRIVKFSASPAVAVAGTEITGTVQLSKPCSSINISGKKISGSSVSVALTQVNVLEYTFSLKNTTTGVYNFTLNVKDDKSSFSNSLDIIIVDGKEQNQELVVNAYEDINWNSIGRFKGNFHTHTSQSFDTKFTTTQVVDKYQKAGYKVLALTDHDANPYPWNMFSLWNPDAEDRNASDMGMLAIPGNELSKDRRNNWSEITGGEFNHHNDFFTGRKGQEFLSLQESYAYSQVLGGLQIINHPGQYWSLDKEYKDGEKNSPQWHANNFRNFDSLIGLEVYNQGNRRQNDRILWDQVLTITMPDRPVWGYSCDDTHTEEQYFRNYQYMLMPDLNADDLKQAMINGSTVFSYEFTGSGEAKAPYVNSIEVDKENKTITIDCDDADQIEWIYSTYRTGSSASSTKSAIIGYGPTFDFSGYQGSYVRARLTNSFGETATQPFGFADLSTTSVDNIITEKVNGLTVINHPGSEDLTLRCTEPMLRISIFNAGGSMVRYLEPNNLSEVTISKRELTAGVYVIVVATADSAYTAKFIR